jgi:hypothetical protein
MTKKIIDIWPIVGVRSQYLFISQYLSFSSMDVVSLTAVISQMKIKIYYLELLRSSEDTLSRWSRLHLQSLAPANSHWTCVVGNDPFSLCVIHKEGLCPSSRDINRLMMSFTFLVIFFFTYCFEWRRCFINRQLSRNYYTSNQKKNLNK